jgi:hypothetical protein
MWIRWIRIRIWNTGPGNRSEHILKDYSLSSLYTAWTLETHHSEDWRLNTGSLLNIFLPWTHSHKAISTRRRGLRSCWAAVHSTCRICPSYSINIFLLLLFCSSSAHQTPCIFIERGHYRICVHKSTFSLEQLLIAPVKLRWGSSSFLKLRVLVYITYLLPDGLLTPIEYLLVHPQRLQHTSIYSSTNPSSQTNMDAYVEGGGGVPINFFRYFLQKRIYSWIFNDKFIR